MLDSIKYDDRGLVPVVIQDVNSGQVLMMAYMNRETLAKTIETGRTWFYSRSRQQQWMKGETSGHIQQVKKILLDCDNDTLLIQVEQTGLACHTGHHTCFYRDIDGDEVEARKFDMGGVYDTTKTGPAIMYELFDVITSRKENLPEGSYTTYLFQKGIDKILKKVGEETAEVIIAAKNTEKTELVYETSDLLYHLMVLMVAKGVELSDLFSELKSRR